MTPEAKASDTLFNILRAQAWLRLAFGIPFVIGGEYLAYRTNNAEWVPTVGAVILLYIISMLVVSHRKTTLDAKKIGIASAIIDPLTYSVWIPILGEYGGLMASFYIFTILGFGFRAGVTQMRYCQVSAIVGFSIVFLIDGFWQQHPIIWASFITMLFLVPTYAAMLLRKLHEARAHAESESQAKTQLLARVSHELRTPLTGIVAATQLMLMESPTDQVGKRAETILGMAKELTEEIQDLLDQAKYESDALVLENSPASIHELMERVRLTIEPAATRKGLRFDVCIDKGILDWVMTDVHYLGRVLINLASNAVKFTASGQVRVELDLLERTKSTYQIRFVVADTGIGIDKEFHQQIFDPYFQVGGGTTRRFGGTGLGMAIASEVVTSMGGRIQIESELGQGTTFHFALSFPRVESPQLGAVAHEAPPVVVKKQILIVDDHVTNLLLLKELLEQDQHVVTTAKSGMEALTLLNSIEIDVAFFDYNLTDMDGAKLMKIYRFGKLKPAPVYFLTADATAITTDKLVASGANGVLHKPVSITELRSAISKVCRNEPTNEVRAGVPMVRGDRQHLRTVPVQLLDTTRIEKLRSTSTRTGFIRELMTQSLSDINLNCTELNSALQSGEIDAIRESAHALKGVCANIGAVRLVGLSSSLMAAKREGFQNGNLLINDLENVRASTCVAIQQYISMLDSPHSSTDLSAGLH